MRKLSLVLGLALVIVAPASARAGFIVEGSLGKGVSVKPQVKAQETSVMVSPGVTLLSMLRLQLGLLAELPDVEGSNFDLELRPMVTVKPPLLPIHGRLVFAFTDLLNSDERTVAYGVAFGFSFSLVGLGVFAEAGILPRSIEDRATMRDRLWWVVEGRAGVSLAF
jgi:hypothetical protein